MRTWQQNQIKQESGGGARWRESNAKLWTEPIPIITPIWRNSNRKIVLGLPFDPAQFLCVAIKDDASGACTS